MSHRLILKDLHKMCITLYNEKIMLLQFHHYIGETEVALFFFADLYTQ